LQGVIGSVGEVQFMGDVGVFGELAKSFTLFACVARMVEHNRRASREQVNNQRRQRVVQLAGAAHIVGDAQDFARTQRGRSAVLVQQHDPVNISLSD